MESFFAFSRKHRIDDIVGKSFVKQPFSLYLFAFVFLYWISLSLVAVLTVLMCLMHVGSNIYFSYSFYKKIEESYSHYGSTNEAQIGRHMSLFMQDMQQQIVRIRNIAIMSALSASISIVSWCTITLCSTLYLLPFTLTLNGTVLFCMLTKNRIMVKFIVCCRWRHCCPLLQAPCAPLKRHRASKQWLRANIRSAMTNGKQLQLQTRDRGNRNDRNNRNRNDHVANQNVTRSPPVVHDVQDTTIVVPDATTFDTVISTVFEQMRSQNTKSLNMELVQYLHSSDAKEELKIAIKREFERFSGSPMSEEQQRCCLELAFEMVNQCVAQNNASTDNDHDTGNLNVIMNLGDSLPDAMKIRKQISRSGIDGTIENTTSSHEILCDLPDDVKVDAVMLSHGTDSLVESLKTPVWIARQLSKLSVMIVGVDKTDDIQMEEACRSPTSDPDGVGGCKRTEFDSPDALVVVEYGTENGDKYASPSSVTVTSGKSKTEADSRTMVSSLQSMARTVIDNASFNNKSPTGTIIEETSEQSRVIDINLFLTTNGMDSIADHSV